MRCPYCGLIIWRTLNPIVWENHIMIHEINQYLIDFKEERMKLLSSMSREEVKQNAGN